MQGSEKQGDLYLGTSSAIRPPLSPSNLVFWSTDDTYVEHCYFLEWDGLPPACTGQGPEFKAASVG